MARTGFYRILVNLCLDHRRRRVGWRRLLVADKGGGGEPDTPLVERQPGETRDPVDDLVREQTMTRLWEVALLAPPRFLGSAPAKPWRSSTTRF
jgi:DNA-directed RNA polymerase specialized sigma24 family protein